MRIVKVELDKLDKTVLNIGWEGEQNHVQVQIQCGAFFAKYPNAGAGLTVLSPANVTYPVVLDKEGNDLIWDIDASDVVNAGSGKIQLTFTDGTGDDAEVIKTVIGSFNVNASLAVDGTAPDPIQHWIDQAEQTARQIAEESAIYAKEEIVESYGSIAPAIIETASGAIASFSDGADGMLVKKMTVDIDPVQDLHGYDSPWPAGGGKNKFNVDALANTADITISNGNIIVKGVSKNSGKKLKDIADLTVGETYILTATSTGTNNFFYLYGTNESWYFSNQRTITQQDLDSTVFFYGISDESVSVTISNMMIRLSSVTDATFAPYENVCPISGWTEAEVTRTGKNLLDCTATGAEEDFNYHVSNVTKTKNGITYQSNGTWAVVRLYRKLLPGTYAISANISTSDSGYANCEVYKENTSLVGSVPGTFTLTEETIVNIRFVGSNATTSTRTVEFSNIQLELASSASAFAPYQGTTIEYAFPESAGTVYGGTLTIHQDGTGELVADHADVDLGTLSWNIDPNRPGVFYNTTQSAPAKTNGSIMADIYKWRREGVPSASYLASANNSISLYPSYGGGRIYVVDISKATLTAAEFKNSVNGISCVYELSTPVTYQLTNQQVIALLKGSNNIWADTGDVAVEYPADTKLYIDGKVAELQALILENISNS